MKSKKNRLTQAVALACAVMAAQAEAQQQPSDQLQTVTVTANKRNEDANKVATSISVIGGEELTAQHLATFADITRAVPNIAFSSGNGGNAGNGAGLSNISMRGISSSAGSATVGVYLDDIAMSVGNIYSMGSAEPKFFDLDHVEVLRGPQGTLYGASSMGGTIKFLGNQPNLKEREGAFYTEMSSTKGGGNSYLANAVFNEPIGNELALRVGVQTQHNGGFIDQVDRNTGALVKSDTNTENSGVLRFAMKWAPTRDLTITPSVFYQKVKTGDIDVSYTQLPNGGAPLPNNQAAKLVLEPGKDVLLVPSLTVNYATPLGDVTSVTSFFQRKFDRTQDGTATLSFGLGVNIINPDLQAKVFDLPAMVYLNNEVRQFSQELRIASKSYDASVSPWTWMAGVYASNQRTNITDNEPIPGLNAAFASLGLSPTDPTVIANPVSMGFPNDNTYFGQLHFLDQQQSLFGEANYYFSPTLHATFGLRTVRATTQLHRQGAYYFNNHLDGKDGYENSTAEAKAHKTTPKLALSWEMDRNNTLYASASQGFRLGGANIPVPMQLCDLDKPNPQSFNPDSLWSYEVGNKSRFLNNRLSVNASAFYVDWKNMQQQVFLACGFGFNTNVGRAKSYGAEVEVHAKPIPSLVLSFAGGMTHATLSDSDGEAAGLPGAVEGARIPGVPKFNATFSAQYNMTFDNDMYGFVRGASRWTGSSYGGFAVLPSMLPNPDYHRPAYNVLEASAGVSWGNYEVTVFAKNLTDNQKIIQRPIVQFTANEAYRIAPRTIGISLSGKL
ncbi:TonB-dependent receptor [Duganella sp. FT135W]|uniref:TonB-dependent receptor n=1 Tax=Duganella flavida TaxID=2692175 RepID=A0A6L8KI96_9BURK|nr:TonB-dependent receptor [Duganella flavida]MYM24241.1 TonB-dependent receptor [Duganella flavida]